jgi:hypothetical protein
MTMIKLDAKKDLKHLYAPAGTAVEFVDVPPMNFLMIDGQGDPTTAPAYADALATLYAVAFAAKFLVKKSAAGLDYTVMPLEGLWWADDMTAFLAARREEWHWTMMIMQPPAVDQAIVEAARTQAARTKQLPALAGMRFAGYEEGRAAQILHIGPYSAEGPTIARLHQFIAEQGYRPSGKHHEIYLSDPRRTAPERMRTIVRQPVRT